MHDETELIRKAIGGSSRALAELLQANYKFLYQYVLKATMDRTKAEDITQETMLKAVEKIASFNFKAKFSTWLIAIATRLVIDKGRRGSRERAWMQQVQALHANRAEIQQHSDDWSDALEALGKLSCDIRIPVLLKYYYGYGQEEIAGMLNIRVGTVKSRLHNGLKQLRKELTEHDKA